ncbi:MAG: peptide-methionine (S)-S-oxide reductase MsrA [Lachnospiraceae bacterium]|nr:peptide-methionine (S)-S-oxide reductase MsrA [Lachnospiraceae bacterium]
MKEIYLAGGCFWGVEKYLALLDGVTATETGYSNGKTENPTYEQVCNENTGHAETVKVLYDPLKISLTFLLELFYDAIDPTAENRQGGDTGIQYRSGIYFTEKEDKEIILGSIALLQESYKQPVMIEVKPLENYYPAEEYHQKYLDKNPGGYCHIGANLFEKARKAVDEVTHNRSIEKKKLRGELTDIQFEVTQNGATEPPFRNEYFDRFEAGIYVDITSGEPLFVSGDKFEAGCGWPSFSRPITADLIAELPDFSHGRERIEVRGSKSGSHLGHVFGDGPPEMGGLRYCINSAALKFIPREKMAEEGYGHLLGLVKIK